MPNSIYSAQNLGEFIELFKDQSGLPFEKIAERLKISESTLYRIRRGNEVDRTTVDRIADMAHVSREWLYEIAFKTDPYKQYPPIVTGLAELVAAQPPDFQEEIDSVIRTMIALRKKPKQNVNE
jgi:transcriptional regulator with XRE-family HTH domain